MIVVVDNYDSFTFNLVQLLRSVGPTGLDLRVVYADAVSVETVLAWQPSHVVISPGPGDPSRAGISSEVLLRATCPVLGVCLGHQCLGAVFGARVVRGDEPVHGKASRVLHRGEGVFAAMPLGFFAARYHSLVVARESVPDVLRVTAETEDGVVMGLQHRERPLHGVQFHPESVLTPEGPRLVRTFLAM